MPLATVFPFPYNLKLNLVTNDYDQYLSLTSELAYEVFLLKATQNLMIVTMSDLFLGKCAEQYRDCADPYIIQHVVRSRKMSLKSKNMIFFFGGGIFY